MYDSDADWLESDDDLVGSDNEGELEMYNFSVILRHDPLESAQLDPLDEVTNPPAEEQQHGSTGTQSMQNSEMVRTSSSVAGS